MNVNIINYVIYFCVSVVRAVLHVCRGSRAVCSQIIQVLALVLHNK